MLFGVLGGTRAISVSICMRAVFNIIVPGVDLNAAVVA